ncbi:MAG TPA: AAA family ATPase [Solirubrobacteraceae bacterium]|nr:AAA family ATPase [Solirubrobacteraceae bacterium]
MSPAFTHSTAALRAMPGEAESGAAGAAGEPPTAADPGDVARAVARLHGDDHGTALVQTRETHISWLFLIGDRAYKLKKPLVLDFLDYGTPRRRREMCEAEVRLNARLAPSVYLGVRAVVPATDGVRLAAADDPEAIDYLVEMRRYAEDETLAAALDRGEVGEPEMAKLAARLARFHAESAARYPASGAQWVRAEIERNLHELMSLLDTPAQHRRVDAVGRFLRAFAHARSTLLDQRAAAGRVREGHGDLRAEHVILEPAMSIVDCVEFDADLRTLDVADELGFLVMDLADRGAHRSARWVLDAYRAAGGDCGPDALVWFYAVHRALVRCKVALVRARQQAPDSAPRGQVATARALLDLSERLVWRARGPLVLVLCGPPASGKSHLAAALATDADLPVYSSDVVRKQLAGLGPQDRAPHRAYTPSFDRRTYGELAHRAQRGLVLRPCVIVDATYRHREDRDRLRERLGPGVSIVFVECLAPEAVLSERARRRDGDPRRVSDATSEVAQRLRIAWEPLDEVAAASHLVLRTDRATETVIADLTALLDERV